MLMVELYYNKVTYGRNQLWIPVWGKLVCNWMIDKSTLLNTLSLGQAIGHPDWHFAIYTTPTSNLIECQSSKNKYNFSNFIGKYYFKRKLDKIIVYFVQRLYVRFKYSRHQ